MAKKDIIINNKDSFFEDEAKSINKEQNVISNNKDNRYGEYYLKNVIYKYNDGINTTVIYNSKEPIYAERNMR